MTKADAYRALQQGMAAAKTGDKPEARAFLQQATQLDPDNELAWLWLAGVAASPEETVASLRRVLAINPANQQAQKGLSWALAQAASAPKAATPASEPQRLPEIKDHAAPKARSGRGAVLAVDDSLTIRRLVAATLEKQGYRVLLASDGMEALTMLEENQPDLVLLDITMPRMDGYQLCKLIKSNPKTENIPVVMLSGKDGFFDKVRGRVAGSSDYLTKPFVPELLVQTVVKHMAR